MNVRFGIQIDRKFLKNGTNAILLVASYKNSENRLHILGIGIVESETITSWSQFLEFLKKNLTNSPNFIMSDRDKGIIPSVAAVFSETPHFYCLRHVMANFKSKFKGKSLSMAVWKMLSSSNKDQFSTAKNFLITLPKGIESFQWLEEIGLSSISLAHSKVQRFGLKPTLTSNNVESINSSLVQIRQMPILQLLSGIENLVQNRWLESQKEALYNTESLTKYASNCLEILLLQGTNFMAKQINKNCVLITVSDSKSRKIATSITEDGALAGLKNHVTLLLNEPKQFYVSILVSKCSCKRDWHTGLPCSHAIKAAQENHQPIKQLFKKIWTSSYACRAYDNSASPTSFVNIEKL